VFGPAKNQPPQFSQSIELIVIEADLNAIKAGTLDPLFKYKLPKVLDFEGNTPSVEMSDNSGTLLMEKVTPYEYVLLCDMSALTIENQGTYSIFFKLEDDKFGESQLSTNTFASVEIKITEIVKEEEEEV
jgi:hypothetical protein